MKTKTVTYKIVSNIVEMQQSINVKRATKELEQKQISKFFKDIYSNKIFVVVDNNKNVVFVNI